MADNIQETRAGAKAEQEKIAQGNKKNIELLTATLQKEAKNSIVATRGLLNTEMSKMLTAFANQQDSEGKENSAEFDNMVKVLEGISSGAEATGTRKEMKMLKEQYSQSLQIFKNTEFSSDQERETIKRLIDGVDEKIETETKDRMGYGKIIAGTMAKSLPDIGAVMAGVIGDSPLAMLTIGWLGDISKGITEANNESRDDDIEKTLGLLSDQTELGNAQEAKMLEVAKEEQANNDELEKVDPDNNDLWNDELERILNDTLSEDDVSTEDKLERIKAEEESDDILEDGFESIVNAIEGSEDEKSDDKKKGLFGGLFGGLSLGIGGFVTAITGMLSSLAALALPLIAIGAIAYSLYQGWNNAGEKLGRIADTSDKFVSAISQVYENILGFGDWLLEKMGFTTDMKGWWIENVTIPFADLLNMPFSEHIEIFKQMIDDVWGMIKGPIKFITDSFNAVWDFWKPKLEAGMKLLGELFKPLVEWMGGFSLENIFDKLGAGTKKLLSVLGMDFDSETGSESRKSNIESGIVKEGFMGGLSVEDKSIRAIKGWAPHQIKEFLDENGDILSSKQQTELTNAMIDNSRKLGIAPMQPATTKNVERTERIGLKQKEVDTSQSSSSVVAPITVSPTNVVSNNSATTAVSIKASAKSDNNFHTYAGA